MKSSEILVVGSINYDRFNRVVTLPKAGETIHIQETWAGVGGKGANQAVAASLSGATVYMVGAVGDDEYGQLAIEALKAARVRTGSIALRRTVATGQAYITVDQNGENTILVEKAANATLTASDLESCETALDRCDLILAQGELEPQFIEQIARQAKRRGARFVLNLAPYMPLSADALASADPIILNENEAAGLLGLTPGSINSGVAAEEAAYALVSSICASAVVTIGAQGAAGADSYGSWVQPATPVTAVTDTTGAGDAFSGAVAAFLGRGEGLRSAVGAGVVAGGLAVTRKGTIDSYPTREELEKELSRVNFSNGKETNDEVSVS